MKVGKKHVYHPSILDIPTGKSGEFEIRHRTIPANQGIDLWTIRHFDHETRWHQLFEGDGSLWMTDLPIEQYQCDELIEQAYGNVIVGGLGIGYATSALALNPAVDRVVTVERSGDVIALVKPHLLRDKPEREKLLEVEHSCIAAYLNRLIEVHEHAPPFDFAFFDTWAGDGEATFFNEVAPLRQRARVLGITDDRIKCWNEDCMRGQLFNALLTRIGAAELKKRDPAYEHVTPSLTELAFPGANPNVFQRWMAPFFRALLAHRWTPQQATDEARAYADCYGNAAELAWLDRFEL